MGREGRGGKEGDERGGKGREGKTGREGRHPNILLHPSSSFFFRNTGMPRPLDHLENYQ